MPARVRLIGWKKKRGFLGLEEGISTNLSVMFSFRNVMLSRGFVGKWGFVFFFQLEPRVRVHFWQEKFVFW